MSSGGEEVPSEDSLNRILLDYVEAIERGGNPNRSELLHRYPEFADEMACFFATRDQLDRLAAPLREGASMISPAYDDGEMTIPRSSQTARFPLSDVGRVGDFRLLREVGRGGMGIVYEAEQVSLRRRVALKVLPFAAAVDPRHLQRFRNEAQAAAQLHHTHIVPVYAVGAEGGVHYYAMQFIDGQSLAQLLSELRATAAQSDERDHAIHPESDSVRQKICAEKLGSTASSSMIIASEHSSHRKDYYRRVAELIRQVADALEYAHQVGIIHRDIKPANLLLDAGNRLWVTDFGLALIRNDVGMTATGELVGTIRYMSPEQALGRPGLVDHRTDIYSLGITLYELLTLTPAFDREDRHMLLRQLAEKDPCPPRTIDPAIPGELETIVLKATAKLPSERYSSAREFAEDLQRFLDDRPILARRPTLIDKIAKWGRRHRTATLSAIIVLVFASVGLGVTATIIAREHAKTKAAYQREREAKVREQERAREAEDHYLRTRRAVDLFVELSDGGLLDFPPLVPLRQRLLEAAVAYYQELNDQREDSQIRKDLEGSQERLARLQTELNAINEINRTLLLEQNIVRTYLDLTPQQIDQFTPFLNQVKEYQHIGFSESSESKRRQIADLAADCRIKVEQILTAAQDRKLRQAYFQLPGPHVFSAAVVSSLGLNESQKREVEKIQAEASLASLQLFATGEPRLQTMEEVATVWEIADQQIVLILTPAQKKQWNEMTGPPIQGKLRFPLPPPGNAE